MESESLSCRSGRHSPTKEYFFPVSTGLHRSERRISHGPPVWSLLPPCDVSPRRLTCRHATRGLAAEGWHATTSPAPTISGRGGCKQCPLPGAQPGQRQTISISQNALCSALGRGQSFCHSVTRDDRRHLPAETAETQFTGHPFQTSSPPHCSRLRRALGRGGTVPRAVGLPGDTVPPRSAWILLAVPSNRQV